MNTTLLLMGVAVAFNFVILIVKYKKKRYADATLDMALFGIICFLFSGTYSGLAVGTVASMLISLYLLMFPVRIFKIK